MAGLVAAAGLYTAFVPGAPQPRTDFPRAALILAGLLVGFGTRMGNGFASGHGVCGSARSSLRSVAAVATFMALAIATTGLLFRFREKPGSGWTYRGRTFVRQSARGAKSPL